MVNRKLYYNLKKNIFYIFIIFIFIICLISIHFKPYHIIKEGLETNEIIPAPKMLLFDNPIKLKRNLGISFSIILNSINTGDWKQILGITPNRDGSDIRIFTASLCPGGNKLAFRTASIDNWDEKILGCDVDVPVNEYIRIDILSNSIEYGKRQNIVVYMTNISKKEKSKQVANVILPPPQYEPGKGYNDGWVFTSYKNVNDVIDGRLKDIVFATGDTDITIQNLDDAINYSKSKKK